MGVGLLYQQLCELEGARVTMRVGHKKKTLEGVIRSVNLHQEGLFMILELPNGQSKLLTPQDRIHDVTFKPQPKPEKGDSLESLAGDGGPY